MKYFVWFKLSFKEINFSCSITIINLVDFDKEEQWAIHTYT